MLAAILLCHAQPPDIVLTGTFSGSDNHTYREVPFKVPAGTGRITIELSYSGRDQRTVIDLGLFDPERFRGWGGGKQGAVSLSETDATPSYLPGPIRAGRWKLLLGVPNIRPGVRSDFTAKIYFERSGAAPAVSTFSSAPLRAGPAWYRGDLHLHTGHSDGSCISQSGQTVPCPAFKIVSAAADRHLDFIAVTDHNSTSHYGALRELQPYFDRLLIIPGREITTFEGHANVFGTTEFIDFRAGSASVPTMNDVFRQVEKLHALISVNHPNDPTGEECMGCRWLAANADLSRVQAVEAVNGGNAEGPLAGIPFWEAQLNRGIHLTGIGGSDTHNPDDKSRAGVGYPTTVVQAAELSERRILEGIRAGNVFIDVEGRPDRLLEMTAASVGATVEMGGTLKAPMGATIHVSVHATQLNGAITEVIQDGRTVSPLSEPAIKAADFRQSFDMAADGGRHWIRVNIRNREGRLLIVGNPIYW
ncbi:MAG: CehA/McbA family metallohydrolase [Bryobacterales bacterium]|nr:CehA/McbA family metallohydrolase [Bryobacterales bacterium]MBV9396821.1 CehA/McbA family metallohydrolase [Bryobacterales bacterium]